MFETRRLGSTTTTIATSTVSVINAMLVLAMTFVLLCNLSVTNTHTI